MIQYWLTMESYSGNSQASFVRHNCFALIEENQLRVSSLLAAYPLFSV